MDILDFEILKSLYTKKFISKLNLKNKFTFVFFIIFKFIQQYLNEYLNKIIFIFFV